MGVFIQTSTCSSLKLFYILLRGFQEVYWHQALGMGGISVHRLCVKVASVGPWNKASGVTFLLFFQKVDCVR